MVFSLEVDQLYLENVRVKYIFQYKFTFLWEISTLFQYYLVRDLEYFQDHSDDAVGRGDGVAVQDHDHLEIQLYSQELECVSNIATDSCAPANSKSFAYWAAQLVGEKSASQGGSSPPQKKRKPRS